VYREFYAVFAGSPKCGKLKVKFYPPSFRLPLLMFHGILISTGEAGPA
jgi:hypothetical protein